MDGLARLGLVLEVLANELEQHSGDQFFIVDAFSRQSNVHQFGSKGESRKLEIKLMG